MRASVVTALSDKKKDKRPERLPDIRPLSLLFMPQANGGNAVIAGLDPSDDIDDRGLLNVANSLNRIDYLNPTLLPTQWVHLTSIDLIFISRHDLQALRPHVEKWDALRKWLSSGTTLCVYDAGANFENLPEIERLFGIDIDEVADPELSSSDLRKRGWSAPNPTAYDTEIYAAQNLKVGLFTD